MRKVQFAVMLRDPETGDDMHEVQLPAQWCICGRCRGEGKTSAHLGSFTREDFDEDPDFKQDYLDGLYDIACEACDGSGKVREIDRDACTSDDQQAALKQMDDDAEDRRESFNERKTESLMLGESTLRDWDGVYSN